MAERLSKVERDNRMWKSVGVIGLWPSLGYIEVRYVMKMLADEMSDDDERDLRFSAQHIFPTIVETPGWEDKLFTATDVSIRFLKVESDITFWSVN